MAYVLGYFAADGSMIENVRGGYYIEITSTDIELLQIVKRVTGSTHKISTRPKRSENCNVSYRIQIGSTAWFSDLEKLGFTPNKSLTLSFPHVPQEYFGDFVRGYFDGDGCVYFKELQYADRKNKRWILMTLFTSGSQSFLKSLHRRLKEYNIRGGVVKPKGKGGFELVFSHRDSLALYKLLYKREQSSHLNLKRKREKLEKAIDVLNLNNEMRT